MQRFIIMTLICAAWLGGWGGGNPDAHAKLWPVSWRIKLPGSARREAAKVAKQARDTFVSTNSNRMLPLSKAVEELGALATHGDKQKGNTLLRASALMTTCGAICSAAVKDYQTVEQERDAAAAPDAYSIFFNDRNVQTILSTANAGLEVAKMAYDHFSDTDMEKWPHQSWLRFVPANKPK